MEVIWTRFAINSLIEILKFVKNQGGSDVSLKVKNKIFRATRNLPKFPFSGVIEPLLINTGKDYRYKLSGNYKIIYRIEGYSIFIIDVFDCRQDPVKMKKRLT